MMTFPKSALIQFSFVNGAHVHVDPSMVLYVSAHGEYTLISFGLDYWIEVVGDVDEVADIIGRAKRDAMR